MLAFHNFQLPFIFHTDASYLKQGLRCALYQIQENQYSMSWATAVGHQWLQRTNITVPNLNFQKSNEPFVNTPGIISTTHHISTSTLISMTYLSTSAKANVTGQRWVNELSNFNFSIHYKLGIENIVADSLSRYPLLQEFNLKQYSHHLNSDEVKSIQMQSSIKLEIRKHGLLHSIQLTQFSLILRIKFYMIQGTRSQLQLLKAYLSTRKKKNGYSWSFSSRKKESIMINIHTNSCPESLKPFCKSGTTYRCMKISITTRNNNNQDN